MTDTVAISVIMPAYNAERYVEEAVRSILDQSFTDFEFLIVDDGSTDGTGAILDQLAREDPRIRVIHRVNGGLVSALNLLVSEARGEFLARMDADDLALPERLGRQIDYLRSHPDCLVVGSVVQVIDPDGDVLCEWFPSRSHEELDGANLEGSKGSVLCHPSVMMRRESVLALGGYREAFYLAEDLDLWLRMAERGRIANLAEPMLKYRCHPMSIGHTQKPRQRKVTREAIAEARQRRGLPPIPTPGVEAPDPATTRPDHNRRWGWWALRSGYLATARKHARAALVHQPFSLQSWRLLYCAIRGR
jgi:glycosyltransferase involved in cell wall biosynthesis